MMNCQQFLQMLDNYIDRNIDKDQMVECDMHLAQCPSCQLQVNRTHQLLKELKELNIPAMSPGFAQRALKNAAQQQQGSHHHRRGFITGFSSAIAAGLVLAIVVVGLLPTAQVSPPLQTASNTTPMVAPLTASAIEINLSVEQVQMVNLVFDSSQAVAGAELSITLPDHVELSGYPGQHVLAWSTDLKQGRNVLSLPLKGLFSSNGELVAHINSQGKTRAIRVQLQVHDALVPHAVNEKYLQNLS